MSPPNVHRSGERSPRTGHDTGSAPERNPYHGRVLAVLRSHVGFRHPGGCLHCSDPYQTLTEDDDGVFHLRVHHDAGCPVLVAWRRASGES